MDALERYAIAARGAFYGATDAERVLATWKGLDEKSRGSWRAAADAVLVAAGMVDAPGQAELSEQYRREQAEPCEACTCCTVGECGDRRCSNCPCTTD